MILKNIKPNRLKVYDYSQNGLYFVTVCTKDRMDYFGEIEIGEMVLNEYGEVSGKNLSTIPDHFKNVVMDECVVMVTDIFRNIPEKISLDKLRLYLTLVYINQTNTIKCG